MIEKMGEKKSADKTIMKTAAYAIGLALKVVVIVSLVGYLGIDTSAITALIASFGVCVGLAVNGALSNLAGVLRDVLVNEKPYILTKHIYAVVSVLGCCIYCFLSMYLEQTFLGTVLVLSLTVIMRLSAARLRWKLPRINFEEK